MWTFAMTGVRCLANCQTSIPERICNWNPVFGKKILGVSIGGLRALKGLQWDPELLPVARDSAAYLET